MSRETDKNNSKVKVMKHPVLKYLEKENKKAVWKLTFATSLAVVGIYLISIGFLTKYFSRSVGIGIGTPIVTGCLTFILYQLSSISSKGTEVRIESLQKGQRRIRGQIRELNKKIEKFSNSE